MPVQRSGYGLTCGTNPSICNHYTADIVSAISLLYGDGLDIRYADNHPYLHPTAAEFVDGIHPTALGQSELRTSFETAIPKE